MEVDGRGQLPSTSMMSVKSLCVSLSSWQIMTAAASRPYQFRMPRTAVRGSDFEPSRIHLKGVVILDYSHEPSHYSCVRSLGDWLSSQGIPGIYGVDTRAITKVIRQHGSMLGKLVVEGSTPSAALAMDDPNQRNLVAEVSRKETEVFAPAQRHGRQVHVLAVDCGMKNNIIRPGHCQSGGCGVPLVN